MDAVWLLSALGFVVAMTATPGPNNAMVTASGATFGFGPTVPHILGISVGFPAMVIAVALGAGGVLQAHPAIYRTMHWVGAAYMLWLAWRIATARPQPRAGPPTRGRPLRFIEAVLFQWVNPKAWVIALGAFAAYTDDGGRTRQVLVLASLFFVVCVPSCALWTGIGARAGRVLRTEQALRWFNVGMAGLLVVSLLSVLWGA